MAINASVSASRDPDLLAALRAEHRHITAVMGLLTQQLNAVERGELVDPHVLYEIMDYMVMWPDRFHHPREDLIYDHVADLDPDAAPDIQELQRDHERLARSGRELLQSIESWRSGETSGSVMVGLGRDYIRHSREHMSIEEREVFPLLNAALGPADWRELAEDDSLHPASDPVFGRRVQREFRQLARKLRRRLRRGVERGAVTEWVGVEAALESFEVLSMALQNGRVSTLDHLSSATRESLYIALDQPLRAPLLCTVNNTRLGVDWLQDMALIYRDSLRDLGRVERERRDRMRLLRRSAPVRSRRPSP